MTSSLAADLTDFANDVAKLSRRAHEISTSAAMGGRGDAVYTRMVGVGNILHGLTQIVDTISIQED